MISVQILSKYISIVMNWQILDSLFNWNVYMKTFCFVAYAYFSRSLDMTEILII